MTRTTASESNYDRILSNAGVAVVSISAGKSMRPDRELNLHGQRIVAEFKEKVLSDFEAAMTENRWTFAYWGAEEGERKVRPTGRVDWSGWAGHIEKAIQQLKSAAENGLPTLIGLQSQSIIAKLDLTDMFRFMYGHGARIEGNQLVVSRDDFVGDLPVLAGFDNWENISGIMDIYEEKITVFANCFAKVPIDSHWFRYDCFRKVCIPGGTISSPNWETWQGEILPIIGVIR